MEYSGLYDLIYYLKYGTKLHIGVEFFGTRSIKKTILPFAYTNHSGRVCKEFKKLNNGFKKCYKCKNATLRKAFQTKTAFSGLCINGIYEYVRPVVIEGKVECIIYIGNILDNVKGDGLLREKLGNKEYLIDTLQKNFTYEQCEKVGALIESYIRMLPNTFESDTFKNVNPIIENIKSYICENIEYQINVLRIAEIFKYNKQYIGRFFKKETNMSINEYITLQRVERAKFFLKESDDKIINIAYKSGFNNVTYFNKLFKKYTYVTPVQYRKLFKEKI